MTEVHRSTDPRLTSFEWLLNGLASLDAAEVLTDLFKKMDSDGNGSVTKDEALRFWGNRFAKVNAERFFHEVDEDGNAAVSYSEFMAFWQHVKDMGYGEEAIVEELDNIHKGEAWVGFAHTLVPNPAKIDKASGPMLRRGSTSTASQSSKEAVQKMNSKY